ncbi:glyoxylate reductase/hydroxypyruvate reductase-like [Babylonia areolata]|uniref:glyoxylate reductase/hydroxypyruvate reductase-like n=1 Tax=Babylonia areolata TaxID=304850 RepID=UPI003FD3C4F6
MTTTMDATSAIYSQQATTTILHDDDTNQVTTTTTTPATTSPTLNNSTTTTTTTSSAATAATTNSSTSVVDDDDILHNLDNFIGRPRSRSLYATMRPLVYITRRVPQRGLDVLLPTCNISQWDSEEAVPRGELLQNVQGVHGILCLPSDLIDLQVLDAAGSNLRAVATLSEDTHHIDVEECARRSIKVLCCPAPDLESQAELTVALILLTLRNMAEGLQMDNRTHDTNCDLFTLTEGKPVDITSAWWDNLIQHKTFGVYGTTSLGLAVAARLRQLGASNVILTDFGQGIEESASMAPPGARMEEDFELVTRQQFLERADIICVCGAHAATQNEAAFDETAFRDMKSDVILVNSDSGHALNYMALYEALRDGQICAAGLNTCNQTPVPFQYPLQGLRNCVFMPQTQEDRTDLRHKVTLGVTTNLLNTLKESIEAV